MARTGRKKKRTHAINPQSQVKESEKVPKSFVISRGKLPPLLKQLQMDLRKLMLPHTALNLKEKRKNTLKDFVHVAAPLGVTHLLVVSNTDNAPYLRVARCPHGPTLTFKIHDYSLAADIARSQSRPKSSSSALFKTPPLIVLAGFGSEEQQLKLTSVMFQNIFPVIDVNTVKLSSCQRVVLLGYNKETKLIDFRHYAITLRPVGVSRRIRKFVQNRQIPDLRSLNDVSEFITMPNYGSESEVEDEAATVKLANDCGRVNRASSQSSVKLQEIGPRMTLQLVKVEEGLCSGGIIFHEFVKKTPEEIKMLRDNIDQREALRKQRRAEQEANVRRKELAKQALKQKSRRANQATMDVEEGEGDDNKDIDDGEWYRREVGEEPDSEFLMGVSRSQDKNHKGYRNKKTKQGKDQQSGKSTAKTDSHKEGKFSKSMHSAKPTKEGGSRKHFGQSIADKILSQKRKSSQGSAHANKRSKGNK
ncbi:hypothetical protein SUGI_0197250 [Cryptomeria japonica]|uniref:peter Pan-like protein n=1 Tax=Cryptomeria japonica TaxID=3369 RepID=UPI002408BC85|nr:peter Pan-like protein [Cryptomeria japonica]XP_059072816.1 peter Pan-like protein [Cryptomeria japonica]XP_059072817.1 peter Pan-like protein [Cryptomeria japonica]XP_059072818.1 peter Pan-like protein [Cryptomeria japonica]XP_059072819.1 peter Pan-like protein [Cryptomeria japonica]XP_059072820.1 peter Pan-like protein [Cryptomeria japonica]GLJ12761.1 hypothetical protein SUGI_0197250 [Cryptomeria japonica]